nr:sugar ABC transporter permease [Marivita sp. GX14005]
MDEVQWVGAENYARLIDDTGLRQSIVNTVSFVLVVAPLSVLGGLWVAVLVAGAGRLQGLFQTVFFLPVTATLVAMATAWEVVLHPSFGMLNALLETLGLPAQRFLSDPDLALWTLAAIAVWKMLGYNVLLFLAGMATIDRQLYEAAALDGAEDGWRRFTLVTWPMLAPVTLFVTVITLIRALGEFELVAVLTNGGPDGATEMVIFKLYQEAFRFFDIGAASALAVVFLLAVMVLSLAQVTLAERRK